MTVTVQHKITRCKTIMTNVSEIYDAGDSVYICVAVGSVTIDTGYPKKQYKFTITT